ncbi:FAD-dependent oxidoreductase, partial [Anaerotruncus colihominis]
MEQMYDLAVIGAGPGGYTAALTAAKLGMRVIVFEKRTLGGACLNIGCIPTKALACSASLYQTFQNCAWFGLSAPQTGFDYAKIHAYKELCVSQSRENIRAQFEAEGVVYIEGRAAVAGARSVRLTTADGVQRMYNARYILIASGARPNRPLFPGVLLPGVVTSTDVLTDSQWHYDRVAVIGGGVVGVELATILGALGAHVTIIEKKERLLAPMDGELSAALETLLRRRGIEVLTNATVERAAEGDGALTCTVRQGQE